jgi:uncharacterized protein YlxW (UPF0749 family)
MGTIPVALQRARSALRRAAGAHRRRDATRTALGRTTTALVCVVVGLLVVVCAAQARGVDLRQARNTDLVSLLQDQSRRNADLTARVSQLQDEVTKLSADVVDNDDLVAAETSLSAKAQLTPVEGPALTVTLDDAPSSVRPEGVDADLLVVHQQDIQAVVNALWSGGAEAMTIQGQRVISTTGIKCVGNTVVLHGVPYAPPYVVSAIGDQDRLRAALADSPALEIYRQYVEAYALGYAERSDANLELPGFRGSEELRYASTPTADGPTGTPR